MKRPVLTSFEDMTPPMLAIPATAALNEALQHLAHLEGDTADLGVAGDAWAAARAITHARRALPILRALRDAQRGW